MKSPLKILSTRPKIEYPGKDWWPQDIIFMFPQYGPYNNCFLRFSTGGSDSSVSDGLPMHLIYAPEGLKLVSIYLGDVVKIAFRDVITFANHQNTDVRCTT